MPGIPDNSAALSSSEADVQSIGIVVGVATVLVIVIAAGAYRFLVIKKTRETRANGPSTPVKRLRSAMEKATIARVEQRAGFNSAPSGATSPVTVNSAARPEAHDHAAEPSHIRVEISEDPGSSSKSPGSSSALERARAEAQLRRSKRALSFVRKKKAKEGVGEKKVDEVEDQEGGT